MAELGFDHLAAKTLGFEKITWQPKHLASKRSHGRLQGAHLVWRKYKQCQGSNNNLSLCFSNVVNFEAWFDFRHIFPRNNQFIIPGKKMLHCPMQQTYNFPHPLLLSTRPSISRLCDTCQATAHQNYEIAACLIDLWETAAPQLLQPPCSILLRTN